ncbi:nitroreductase family deazaflavin-dependent oxidoreductase [Agromyces bauzanensis]
MPTEKPGPVASFLYRAPVALYRARLGWILGGHFLVLTTTGRKSGRTRRTALEVARRAGEPGKLPTLWVVASRGRHTDWYANAVAGGPTRVTWKTHTFTPQVHALDPTERADLLADYQRRHPRAAAMLGSAVLGGEFTADPDQLQRLAAELRALRLDPPGTDVATAR